MPLLSCEPQMCLSPVNHHGFVSEPLPCPAHPSSGSWRELDLFSDVAQALLLV